EHPMRAPEDCPPAGRAIVPQPSREDDPSAREWQQHLWRDAREAGLAYRNGITKWRSGRACTTTAGDARLRRNAIPGATWPPPLQGQIDAAARQIADRDEAAAVLIFHLP